MRRFNPEQSSRHCRTVGTNEACVGNAFPETLNALNEKPANRAPRGEEFLMSRYVRIPFALAAFAALGTAHAQQPAAPASVKLGIVSFLTGPAASPFGIPGRDGAEIFIEALNADERPP